MPIYVITDATGRIIGRIVATDPIQAANYSNITSVTLANYDRVLEIWATISGSNTPILAPTSSIINPSTSFAGGGGEVTVNSVASNAGGVDPSGQILDVNTPRVIYSFFHQLSIINSEPANAAIYDRDEFLINSKAFTSFNITNLFSHSVVTSIGAGQYNLKLSWQNSAALIVVSSQILLVEDAGLPWHAL